MSFRAAPIIVHERELRLYRDFRLFRLIRFFLHLIHFSGFIGNLAPAAARNSGGKEMDIEKELLKEHSKAQALRIAEYIDGDPGRFAALMDLYLNSGYRVNQRSAMVVGICADRRPDLVYPYLDQLIENLRQPDHDAIKRNTVRILQNFEIPEPLWGDVWDICYAFLTNPKEPVAIRVFSMSVLFNLVKKLPELKNELKIAVEDQMPYSSAAFTNRGGKILMKLEKMGSNY